MDLVLGLSITSAAIRFVLVEGTTGEGATVDRGTLAYSGPFADSSVNALIDAVMGDGPFAVVPGNRPKAIGVTWSGAVAGEAAQLLEKLTAKGADSVIPVSESQAAAALAAGIGDIAGHEDVAVCIVEPDAALLVLVDADNVHIDHIGRPAGASVDDLARSVAATVAESGSDAMYVLGSADDLDDVVSALERDTESPVISAAEADLALARGAALASARSFGGVEVPAVPVVTAAVERPSRPKNRVAALSSVLVAAVLTFVVSLSVALGLQLTPDADSDITQRQVARVSDQPPLAKPDPAPQAAPQAPPPAAPPPAPEAPPPPPEELPPPPEAPIVDAAEVLPPAPEVLPANDVPAAPPPVAPPPAPVAPPPAPAYAPPPPAPAYVPPAPDAVPPPVPGLLPGMPATQPQPPRLRDRIIERIPIINRFHEPQYPTP